MIDLIVTHQALIREWINGVSMILFLTLTLMVAVFMWDSFIAESTSRNWTRAPGVPTACALWWIFAAETYRAGAVWFLYQVGKQQRDSGVFFAPAGFGTSIGYLIAGIMLIGGLLRSIYVFTPPGWERRVWCYAAIAAVVFCSLPSLTHTIGKVLPYGQ